MHARAAQLWLAVTLPQCYEPRALERLAAVLSRFSPRSSLAPPDALLLEIQGSLRLFGGLSELRRQIAAACTSWAQPPRLAVAATPLAALWLSRAPADAQPDALHVEELAGRLAALPLTVCRWPAAAMKLLHEMGIDSVGECLRLPRTGLARRIGMAPLESLDRALGRRPDPRAGWLVCPRFRRRLELPEETENCRQLLSAMTPLLEDLAAFLQARQGGVQRLELVLEHLGLAPTRLTLEGVRPAREAAHWQLLLDEHLQRLVLPAPVAALTLCSGRMEPLAPAALSLGAPPVPSASDLPQLVERLQARLGREAVHGLGLLPAHRPEVAWRKIPVPVAERPGVAGPEAPRRPLWLLPQPVPLHSEQGWPCRDGRLVLEQGPERIESGWWDGHDVARDYYVARSPRGARLWIYRRRRPPHRWFLHGFFG